VAVAAHPAGLARRHTHHEGVIGHIGGDHSASSDEGVPANRDPAHHGGVGTNGTTSPENRPFIQRVPIDLRSGVGDVGQDARRTEKNVVFHHGTRIDGYVVLDLDVVADDDLTGDVYVLAQAAACPQPARLLQMAKVPNLGSGTDLARLVDTG
jgi:hypothetical protein